MGSPDLTKSFQQNACPADLPVHDAGIDPVGYKVPLTEVVAAALPHAKVFMYADTNHHNPMVTTPTSSKPFLETLRDGGVQAIKQEVGQEHQALLEKYKDGALTRQEFEDRVQKETNLKGNSAGDTTRAIGRTAEFTSTNHMDYRFSDPGNGFRPGEDHRDRFKDTELIADLNATPGKVFLQYGHAHFSMDAAREQVEGGMVKMDVYQNRQRYEGDKPGMESDNKKGFNFNQAKPDLIYFQDTRTVHTTCATSPALKADIEKVAADYAPKPTPAPTPSAAPAPAEAKHEMATP